MPGTDELTYIDQSDFTSGLWERTDREAPPNGLLELTDAFPQVNGGLRAFGQFKNMTQGNAGAPDDLGADEIIVLLQKEAGWPGPQGILYAGTLRIDAVSSGIHSFRLRAFQNDTTVAQLESGDWKSIFDQSNIANFDPSIKLDTFHSLANGFGHYFNLSQLDSAGLSSGANGIYRTNTSASTSTAIDNASRVIPGTLYPTAMAVHQERIVFNVTAPGLPPVLSRALYTEPRSDTAPSTANQFEPIGTDAGFISWMEPVQPSDMVVGKDSRGIILAQGDMTAPIIREMTFSKNNFHMFPAVTEQGMAHLVSEAGVYLWSSGGLRHISPQFFGTPMEPGLYPANFSVVYSSALKIGQMTYAGQFLFAGKDYVWDSETEAWFRVSALAQNGGAKNFTHDPHNLRVYASLNAVNDKINPILLYLRSYWPLEGGWEPVSSYSFTLPLIYSEADVTNLRELQYFLTTFEADSTLSVELTYFRQGQGVKTETLPTVTLDAATNHNVRVLAPVSGAEWIKVKTTVRAPTAEAPMTERVMVGIQRSTRRRAS